MCFFFVSPCGGGGGVKPHFDHCALGIFLKNLNGTVAASNVGLGWLRIQNQLNVYCTLDMNILNSRCLSGENAIESKIVRDRRSLAKSD